MLINPLFPLPDAQDVERQWIPTARTMCAITINDRPSHPSLDRPMEWNFRRRAGDAWRSMIHRDGDRHVR
jgi:hypothetical protein